MNNIKTYLNSNTPTNSDIYLNKNQSSSSNYLLTYTANKYNSNHNKFDSLTKHSQKSSMLTSKNTKINNLMYEKDEELIEILGYNRESLNTISNIQAYDKTANLNIITNNSKNEFLENLIDIQESNENIKINEDNKNNCKNYKIKNSNSEFNYVNEKNIFKNSQLLINKNPNLQKSITNKFEYSPNSNKPKNNKSPKDETNFTNNSTKQNKKLLEKTNGKIVAEENLVTLTNKKENYSKSNNNKLSISDFNKTINKRNRHSLTSNPCTLNDILNKIKVIENIEEKILSVRESNDKLKSLDRIDEVQINKKNSLKNSLITKNSISNSNNKFIKLIQTKDFKFDKIYKKSNPIIKRDENTSKYKKLDSKRFAEGNQNSNLNGFKTFDIVNGHLKKFSTINSLSNSDSFINTSLNFFSNPDYKKLKINKEDESTNTNKKQKQQQNHNKINNLVTIDEFHKNYSIDLSAYNNNKEENIKKPYEHLIKKTDIEKNAIYKNNENSNKKKKNQKKLNLDKRISNLRDEMNTRLEEINGITLYLDTQKAEEENIQVLQTNTIQDIENNLKSNSNTIAISNNNKKTNYDKITDSKSNNFNQIFENNIRQLEEKFANFKKKIKVQNRNLDKKKESSDINCYSTYENNLNSKLDNKIVNKKTRNESGKTSAIIFGSDYKKNLASKNIVTVNINENNIKDQENLNELKYLNYETIEDNIYLKNANYSSRELEKKINKITNYYEKNRIMKDDRNKSNKLLMEINTDISNFETEIINTEMNHNNMLVNLDTLENLDILKTEIPSLNKNHLAISKNTNNQFVNDITLENVENSCILIFYLIYFSKEIQL
jgi:hypothetical protein